MLAMIARNLSMSREDSVDSNDDDIDLATWSSRVVLNDPSIEAHEYTVAMQDYLGADYEPLDGNIYKYFAFRRFFETPYCGQASVFTPPSSTFDYCILTAGLIFIMIIQVLAPIGILSGNAATLIASCYNPFRPDAYFRNYELSQWIVVLCAQAFLFCFILNAYKATVSDGNTMKDIGELAALVEKHGQPVRRWVLILDALVNSYAAVFLSVSMFTILFSEENAQGVIFDSLSLAFVLNIDDLSSDLGFLGDVWDANKIGKFLNIMRRSEELFAYDEESPDDEALEVLAKTALDNFIKIPLYIYSVTQYLLLSMLPFALCAPFFVHAKAAVDPNLRKLWYGEIFQNALVNMTAKLET